MKWRRRSSRRKILDGSSNCSRGCGAVTSPIPGRSFKLGTSNGIVVVRTVAEEVEAHDSNALNHIHVSIVGDPPTLPALAGWKLDAGETAALSLAVSLQPPESRYFLCDEMQARAAARALDIPVLGSLGLIIRAYTARKVEREEAEAAMLALPKSGRLHVRPMLLHAALKALREDSD